MTGRVLSPAETDARFFERFAGRSHRIRVAAASEAIVARRRGFLTMDPPEGFRPYVGVRAEGFGRLEYTIGHLRGDADTDMAESDARECFAVLRRQSGTLRATSPADQQEVPRA